MDHEAVRCIKIYKKIHRMLVQSSLPWHSGKISVPEIKTDNVSFKIITKWLKMFHLFCNSPF